MLFQSENGDYVFSIFINDVNIVQLCSLQPKGKPKTPAAMPDAYVLIGIPELKCLIEVSNSIYRMILSHSNNPNVKTTYYDKSETKVTVT